MMRIIKKRHSWLVSLATGLSLVFVSYGMVRGAGQTSLNYTIQRDVLCSGGGTCSSPSYTILAVLGQASGVGVSLSDSYTNYSGFWFPLEAVPLTGDLNGDRVVDLTDAMIGFQILIELNSPDLHEKANLDPLSPIGLAEVSYIMQKISGLR